LVEAEHEVFFLQLESTNNDLEKRPLPSGIERFSLELQDLDTCLEKIPQLQKLVAGFKPDLIQAGPVQTAGLMVAKLDFHPFVVMPWGSDLLIDSDKNADYAEKTRFTLSHADLAICDCNSVKLKLQSLVPFADEKIVKLPFGTNVKTFFPPTSPS
jgi:hypothetical protein